jgi:hypothetical protein
MTLEGEDLIFELREIQRLNLHTNNFSSQLKVKVTLSQCTP